MWVGFLQAVMSIVFGTGVTKVSKKGKDPSVLGSSTVNCM